MKTLLILSVLLGGLCGFIQAAERPNIIVILADDLGHGDVSCYGATKIRTPNIDRLAREGMKFTDAHTAATVCSPSHYGLMTGRSPWRLHRKGNEYSIEARRMTLASLVKAQGYRSAAIGKWHLGYGKDWNQPPILLGKSATGPLRSITFIQGDTQDNAITVRSAQWKLIETSDSRKQKTHQLYDLSADPGETNNIAKQKPEVVQQLVAELDKARADGRTRNRN